MSRVRLFPRHRVAKVLIGHPRGGSVTGAFHDSTVNLQHYEMRKRPEERLLWCSDGAIGVRAGFAHSTSVFVEDNRMALTRGFLDHTDADWLLQVDTDIQFPANLLETMLAIAGNDRKIVAANVPLGDYSTVAMMRTPNPAVWHHVERLQGDVMECDAAATAAMLVHRDVFEGIAEQHGRCWFHRMQVPASVEGTPLRRFEFASIGEDVAFCIRARACGFSVFAARVPGLRHHKTRALSEDFQPEPLVQMAEGG